ncbi:MAG: hypothetical protein H7335_09885 [Massilia sp.]|nr:hypothetical protein [Massilia sp.]
MNFDEAFTRLLKNEGGYTNNPADPGGETKWGISKRSYPNVDIKALTQAEAGDIYRRDFWSVLGEDVHPAIKFQAFDFGVNSGVQTAIRKLQAAIGVADDGHWGPVSASALAKLDVNVVLMCYMAQRLRFWANCGAWSTMGAGWVKRASEDLEYAAKDR